MTTPASPPPDDPRAPGSVLAGKYEVARVLAEGGMGLVVEARHLRLAQRVAIKVLHPQLRDREDFAARFEREARAAARLHGAHVARVLDVDSLSDGTPFLVMEFLEGHDLSVEIARRAPLPVVEAARWVLQACAAMAEAHRLGIVHRDLKPSNLFLAEGGEERTLKVLDFGISKVTTEIDAAMTATHSVLGTPLYMSPEQVRSAKNVDARSDVWSLGVILYEMLAGQPPFSEGSATAIAAAIVADEPTPLRDRRPDVPAALSEAVMKALSKSPAERFPDVGALADAVAPWSDTPYRASLPSFSSQRQAAVIRATGADPAAARANELVETAPAAVGIAPAATPDGRSLPTWTDGAGDTERPPAGATRRRAWIVGAAVSLPVAAAVAVASLRSGGSSGASDPSASGGTVAPADAGSTALPSVLPVLSGALPEADAASAVLDAGPPGRPAPPKPRPERPAGAPPTREAPPPASGPATVPAVPPPAPPPTPLHL